MNALVGVSSRNQFGASAVMSVIPESRRRRKPVSATMRSRAKRLTVSTMIVHTPLLAIGLSASAKPARASRGPAPLDDLVPGAPGAQ